jgi:hypothetical protein
MTIILSAPCAHIFGVRSGYSRTVSTGRLGMNWVAFGAACGIVALVVVLVVVL